MQVMLDLETMGNGPNAAIVAIGAVKFNAAEILDRFYTRVDLESAVSLGGVIDPSTIIWWLVQSTAARGEIVKRGEHLIVALTAFTDWLNNPDTCIWGNGAAFDNVILASAYRNARMPIPWKFRNDRCYRTVKAINPHIPPDAFVGTKHNALADAEHQALHLMKIWRLTR